MGGIEQGWGLQVILWLQSWRTELIGAAGLLISFLGSEDFIMLFLALVYWCVDAAFGRRLAVLYLVQAWFNTMLKEVFQRPRPYTVSSEVKPLALEESPGLPSGHTQTAAVVSGALAMKFRRNWLTIVAVIFTILMALARMIVGVHYPQDVIAGAALALVVLALFARLEPLVSAWVNGRALWTQIGLAVIAGLAVLVIYPLLIPGKYPDDLSVAFSTGGAVIGAGVGFALETRYVRFSDQGRPWQLVVRFLLGVALVLAVRYGLSAAFSSLEPAWLFRVIRYTFIGLSVGWGAPWLFVKLKLAGQRPA